MLPEENDDAISAFLGRSPNLEAIGVIQVLDEVGLPGLREAVRPAQHGLQMSPRLTGTDGFYAAALRRVS
jgi:16S rRNA (cytosine967-C5)-methyltransferase